MSGRTTPVGSPLKKSAVAWKLCQSVHFIEYMETSDDLHLSSAFVTVSTDGSAPDEQFSTNSVSVVTDHTPKHTVKVVASHEPSSSQTPGHPLARVVSKQERPILSSWIWSDEFDSQSSQPRSLDNRFEKRILRGVTIVQGFPPAWFREPRGRQPGTLNLAKDSLPLSLDGGGAQMRRRHLKMAVTRSPVLAFTNLSLLERSNRIQVYHNAMRSELRSLYTITSSLGKRQYDLNESDVQAFYAWLALFGDFLRIYFSAGERYILNRIEDTADRELRDDMCSSARKKKKLSIVRTLEEIESMKRPMQARPGACENVFPVLIGLIDSLTMSLLHYMNSEFEQLPSVLASLFHTTQLQGMFRQVDLQMLQSASGPLLQVILSRGSSERSSDHGKWLKEHVQTLLGVSRIRAPIEAQRWYKRYAEVHLKYVRGFEKAESEYKRLYN